MNRVRPLFEPGSRPFGLMVAVALTACLLPMSAIAQDQPSITVVIVNTVGFDDDEMFELRYGLEQIVRDYDEFDVVDEFALRDLLTSSQRRDYDDCWTEMGCFIDVLSASSLDALLIVETEEVDDGYVAHITSVDLDDGQIVAEQEGFFPDAGDSLFLLAPIFETIEPLAGPGQEPIVEPDQPETPEPQPWLPPPDDKPERNILATSFMAGGGALMLVGITFYILADNTQEEIQSEPHDRDELSDLRSTGQTQQTVGNVTLISGAILLAAGIVFELTGVGAPKDDFDFGDDDDWVRLNLGLPGGSPYVGVEVDF